MNREFEAIPVGHHVVYSGRHGLLKGYGPYEIGSHEQIDVNIGRFTEYKEQQAIEVQVKVRDLERNPYYSITQLNLNQTQSILLSLSEGQN
ncbi:MAG: hypothetical protein WAN82_04725 [Candidatus Bathyarchaeia archaeon]